MKRVGEENCNGFIFKKKKSVQKVNFRRSSFGHRGKRSLLEIHPCLPSQDYYKHISPLDSDPVRMKQLLILIGQKSLSNASPVREVQLKLLDRIKSQSLSWYHRKRTTSEQETLVVKKENPVNLSNKKQLQEFTNVIYKLSKEISEWKSLLHDYSLKYEEKKSDMKLQFKSLEQEEQEKSLEQEEIPLENLVPDIHQLRHVFYKLEMSSEKISKNTEILFSQILKSYNQKNVKVDTIQMLKLLN